MAPLTRIVLRELPPIPSIKCQGCASLLLTLLRDDLSCLIEQPLAINRSDARPNVNLALTKSAIKDYNLDSLACYIPFGDTMTQTWQLQEAKNKLSKVVDDALSQGPQIITRRGVEVVIVIAYEQFKKMNVSEQKLSDFFRSSPLVGEDLDLTRDKSAARDDLTL